ncbi:ESX secretion-associated protein EspG [Mycobacterium sp. ACS4331]|uniref:ESX secretion-associated protein EspG n=1 Tax=Mycobacterium sp. ACS4331 TaxID=1834121 RepID=UPI0007FD0166|nr:ESX secretion-associated protein EspG [Mycobacterium sp. ACS4331]OBF24213.1 secretion protein EspG [Mycobacterium sp. ACS4331]
MLTTTLDGLWVLQVLSGIEVLAPELALRPHVPSVEPRQAALDHPMAAELRDQGVIDVDGVVDGPILEWLTVIAKRDVALVINVTTPVHEGSPRRVLLARFAQWWAALERSDDLVRISGVGTASVEGAATALLSDQIERLCSSQDPAPIRPVTVDAGAMVAAVDDSASMRRWFTAQGLDADQVRLLMLASDPQRSAQASMVAVQSGVEDGSATRTLIGQTSVTIVDTPEGRLLYEVIHRDNRRWMLVSPGSQTAITDAVSQLLQGLPANSEWYSYRKVV